MFGSNHFEHLVVNSKPIGEGIGSWGLYWVWSGIYACEGCAVKLVDWSLVCWDYFELVDIHWVIIVHDLIIEWSFCVSSIVFMLSCLYNLAGIISSHQITSISLNHHIFSRSLNKCLSFGGVYIMPTECPWGCFKDRISIIIFDFLSWIG